MNKKLWQSGTQKPKDGSWMYVLRLVNCLECDAGEFFTIGHFQDGKWIDQDTGKPILERWPSFGIADYLNIELFCHHGENYRVED